MDITLHLEPDIALFYTRVASSSGHSLPRVLEDALFLLAGELSMEAIRKRQPQNFDGILEHK